MAARRTSELDPRPRRRCVCGHSAVPSPRSDLQPTSGESELRARRTGQSLAIPIGEELLDALADRLEERLQGRKRWATIKGLADYLGITVRQARGLRERGLPANNARPLLFDLRVVDEWLESRAGA